MFSVATSHRSARRRMGTSGAERMNHIWTLPTAALAAASVALAGCGSSAKPSTTSTTAPSTASDQTAALVSAFDRLYPAYLADTGAATTTYMRTTCDKRSDGKYTCQIVIRINDNVTAPANQIHTRVFVFSLGSKGCWTPVSGSGTEPFDATQMPITPYPHSPEAGGCISGASP